jgi:hypothetical protein
MQAFVGFAVNAILGGLARYGMGEAAAIYGFTPLFFECTGLVGGYLAGAAMFI